MSVCHLYIMAQDNADNNVPNLNGHYFIPVSRIADPYIKSHFITNLGIAQSSEFDNFILEIDGKEIRGLKGSLIFATLDFEYQQKIKDWIAMYISYSLTARIGTELSSILTQGVSAVSSSRIGWLIKLVETEKFMLSADLEVNNHNATFISISEFIKDIIKDTVVTSISRNVPILNMTGGLRFAYGINKTFGIQGNVELGYGDSYRRGISDYIYRIGAAFDANLAYTTKVPLGFTAFFNSSATPDYVHVAGKSATITGLKISYAAGRHFNIGLELSSAVIPIPNVKNKVTSTSAVISSRYYFN